MKHRFFAVVLLSVACAVNARAQRTEPSGVRAFSVEAAGATVGSLAGVGVIHLLTEEANVRLNRPGVLVVFSLAQGMLTAAGSRFGASLR